MEKIIIYGDGKHPPFEFIDYDGRQSGFNVDITKAIGDEMDLDIELNLLKWTEAIELFDKNKNSLIQGMSMTGERPEIYSFGPDYITVFHNAFALKEREDIKTLMNLDRYIVAVQEDDVALNLMMKMGINKPPISLMVLSSQEDALKLLFNGKVDLIVGNKHTVMYFAEEMKRANDIKIIGSPLNLTKYGIAFHKENKEILEVFETGMNRIKQNGIYGEIYDKWFSNRMGYFGRQIVDNIDLGVIYINKLGGIVSINEIGEKILNIKKEKIQFKSFYETELSNIFETAIVQRIIDNRIGAYQNEISIRLDKRRKSLSVNYIALFDENNNNIGVLINFRDLTLEKAMRDALARRDKMESFDLLLLNLAHEIRNPLTSMKNFINLIPKHIDDEEFREALMFNVPREIDYIDTLLSELLEHSKPREANKSIIKLKEFIEDIIQNLFNIREDNSYIIIEINIDDDFTIEGDITQLKQAFINIFKNAIESFEENGEKIIYVNAYEEEKEKIIDIENTGKLISEYDLNKIYDPFYTTKEEGTGLGLFITYKLIKKNDGFISISNIKDRVKVSILFSKEA